MTEHAGDRFEAAALTGFACRVFEAAGLADEIARAVAETLVDADLMGYTTHGLQFVPSYVAAIERGVVTASGTPAVVRDDGAALTLDGGMLPGPWVVRSAVEMALVRVERHPVVTVAVRRSHNTACLATYVRPIAERGLIGLVAVSAATNAAVAPTGGRVARYSTNPIAAGLPTTGDPLLIDISTASTTNRMTERRRRAGRSLDFPALIDGDGEPSDDPAVLDADPPGAILPLGGIAAGHKGYALAVLIEALTSALAGSGRAAAEDGAKPGSSVFVQIIDPGAFGGDAYFKEMTHFANYLRATPPVSDASPVRVPGDRAVALRREQLDRGVALHAEILGLLGPVAERFGVPLPGPIG